MSAFDSFELQDAKSDLREIETLARKADECLWAASQAIANRSPSRRDVEMRLAHEHLSKIIELART